MFNFGYIPKEVIKERNPNWQEIPGHPYRMLLIVRGSGSGKNALLNLINNESEIDKVYLYAKDLYEANTNFQLRQEKLDAQNTLMIQKLEYSNEIKNVLQNHILFWLLILLLHQIILYVSERIF